MGNEWAAFVLGVSFSAGICYEIVRRTRNDLTGFRKVYNVHLDRERQRFIHTIVVLMIMSESRDMKAVFDLLKRDAD